MVSVKSKNIDPTKGAIFGKVIRYSLPLAASNVIQLLYNAADQMVVGKFDGETALAAVGSTSSLCSLMVSVVTGLSIGVSVLVSLHIGANEHEDVSKTVHTAIAAGGICGAIMALIAIIIAKPLLFIMGSPEEVIDLSALYVRIFFLGMPGSMIYNYGSAVFRARGNTKIPLTILSLSGIVNVIFNAVFVIFFKMSAAGVALATIISQYLSAIFVVIMLMRLDDSCKLYLSKIRLDMKKMRRIFAIGIPAGLQSALFSVSNVVIQSSINSFGKIAMAGCSAATNIGNFIAHAMNAVHHAALNFTSQNIGAKKPERIKRVFASTMTSVIIMGTVMGLAFYLLDDELLSLYAKEGAKEVVEIGKIRLHLFCCVYWLNGAMDVMNGMLRGLGKSIAPTLITLIGACGLRLLWVDKVFPLDRTLNTLYLSFPISWGLVTVAGFIYFMFSYRKLMKKFASDEAGLLSAKP